MKNLVLFSILMVSCFFVFHNALAENQTNTSIRVGNENATEVQVNLKNFLIGHHMQEDWSKNMASYIENQQKQHRELYKMFDTFNTTSYMQFISEKPEMAKQSLNRELQQKSWYDIETKMQKNQMLKLLAEYKQSGKYRDWAYQQ